VVKPVVVLLVMSLLATGCSGATLEPLGDGGFVGTKQDDAVALQLSEHGLAELNERWPLLLDALAPGRRLTVPLPCTAQRLTVPGIGTTELFIADQGGPSGGRSDGACDARDAPANVEVTVIGLSVSALQEDRLELALSLTMETGKVYLTNPHSVLGYECDLTCALALSSAMAAPPENEVALQVRLRVDPRWDRLVAFDVERLEGSRVCGAAGALARPTCLDPGDLSMSDEGSCLALGWACELLDVDVVKALVLQQLSPILEAELTALVVAQACRACGAASEPCPSATDGTGEASACQEGTCVDPRGGCVPRFLGVEGLFELGEVAPGASGVGLSIAAGGAVAVEHGLLVGGRAGVEPAARATCVPALAPPEATPAGPPAFDAEASPGLEYDVAGAVSASFLDRALWAAHQAGGLCLELEGSRVGPLDTGLMRVLVPSLAPLAGRDGHDAPMMLVVRPELAPRVEVGPGGVEPATGTPRPALTVVLDELSLDLYALVDDRMVRVLTLTCDVSAPVSFALGGCDQVTPVVGRLTATDVRATNAEALAEDPAGLVELLPTLLALAQPALAAGLGPVSMPTVGGLRLEPLELKGLGPVEGGPRHRALGLYARVLAPDDPRCPAP
jgi:hypothetical protein